MGLNLGTCRFSHSESQNCTELPTQVQTWLGWGRLSCRAEATPGKFETERGNRACVSHGWAHSKRKKIKKQSVAYSFPSKFTRLGYFSKEEGSD